MCLYPKHHGLQEISMPFSIYLLLHQIYMLSLTINVSNSELVIHKTIVVTYNHVLYVDYY